MPGDWESNIDRTDNEIVDWDTFNQILEMDDPGSDEFSVSIVFGFFTQAEETFDSMETALKEKDLETLSQLGHFLKGSSATLGLTKVKNTCEKIQHLGSRKDETGTTEIDDSDLLLDKISSNFEDLKEDYSRAEKFLKDLYGREAAEPQEEE